MNELMSTHPATAISIPIIDWNCQMWSLGGPKVIDRRYPASIDFGIK